MAVKLVPQWLIANKAQVIELQPTCVSKGKRRRIPTFWALKFLDLNIRYTDSHAETTLYLLTTCGQPCRTITLYRPRNLLFRGLLSHCSLLAACRQYRSSY
jgi:SH3-like domain-containing protein